jgi:glucosamine-6-phosphate deaminase
MLSLVDDSSWELSSTRAANTFFFMHSHSPSAVPGLVRAFAADALAVRVYEQQADLALDAAKQAQACLLDVINRNGSAAVILATGNSQLQFLDALVPLGGVDWSRVTLFHMDEYLGISDHHGASFRRYMRERVEARVKPRAFHYLAGDALLPLSECERYSRLLTVQPIDLCCLGIGENGHIAFNDPPVADFLDPHKVKLVKLDESCRLQQVGEGHFPNLDAVPQYAFTLTIPMLCSARKMLCIVPERRKAQAVHDSLKGPIGTACPVATLLWKILIFRYKSFWMQLLWTYIYRPKKTERYYDLVVLWRLKLLMNDQEINGIYFHLVKKLSLESIVR